jgi:hypothetical protein
VAALVALAVDLDGVLRHELARALDQRDLAGLHQALQPLVEAGDHVVLVGVDPAHVDARQRALHAELLSLARGVGDLGRVQEGLGGDAAAVQAGAADLVLLHQRDRQAELGGAERAGVPARARAEDDDVVRVAHCSFSRVGV